MFGNNLQSTLDGVGQFLQNCEDQGVYGFYPGCAPNAFSVCFGIFIKKLLNEPIRDERVKQFLIFEIHKLHIREFLHAQNVNARKVFLQKFMFLISAADYALGSEIVKKELSGIVEEINKVQFAYFSQNLPSSLGPKTGNISMGFGVAALLAFDWHANAKFMQDWIASHEFLFDRNKINDFKAKPYSSIQNTYHHYVIVEELMKRNQIRDQIPDALSKICKGNLNKDKLFSPWPGGSSCFDYDHLFLLIRLLAPTSETNFSFFENVFDSICSLQNDDGGFPESRWGFDFSRNSLIPLIIDLYKSDSLRRKIEKTRLALAYARPKSRMECNHFGSFSYWSRNKSTLWDTYFRLLSLIELACFLGDKEKHDLFLSTPGIGSRPYYLYKLRE